MAATAAGDLARQGSCEGQRTQHGGISNTQQGFAGKQVGFIPGVPSKFDSFRTNSSLCIVSTAQVASILEAPAAQGHLCISTGKSWLCMCCLHAQTVVEIWCWSGWYTC